MAKILILEDDAVSQKVLAGMLTKEAHQCLLADTIAEAWNNLEANLDVDLLVLDSKLQGERGWELLQRVRQDPILAKIPVVIYSAEPDRQSVITYIRLGVQNVLVKPYHPEKLRDEIDKALKADWRQEMMEPEEVTLERLGLSREDYHKLLYETARQVQGAALKLQRALHLGHADAARDILSSLVSTAVNTGIHVIEAVSEAAMPPLKAGDFDKAHETAGRLLAVTTHLRKLARIEEGEDDEEDGSLPPDDLLDLALAEPDGQSAENHHPAIDLWRGLLRGPFLPKGKPADDPKPLTEPEALEAIAASWEKPAPAALAGVVGTFGLVWRLPEPTRSSLEEIQAEFADAFWRSFEAVGETPPPADQPIADRDRLLHFSLLYGLYPHLPEPGKGGNWVGRLAQAAAVGRIAAAAGHKLNLTQHAALPWGAWLTEAGRILLEWALPEQLTAARQFARDQRVPFKAACRKWIGMDASDALQALLEQANAKDLAPLAETGPEGSSAVKRLENQTALGYFFCRSIGLLEEGVPVDLERKELERLEEWKYLHGGREEIQAWKFLPEMVSHARDIRRSLMSGLLALQSPQESSAETPAEAR
ncbi:MAG: response regulator [Puniceicoccaceae bacterium]|nr:MAG: response regulator [Puniceicoccaceae bacterium]